jgi:hypothetical protein
MADDSNPYDLRYVYNVKSAAVAYDEFRGIDGRLRYVCYEAAKLGNGKVRFMVIQSGRIIYKSEMTDDRICADEALSMFICQFYGYESFDGIDVLLETVPWIETNRRDGVMTEV